MVGVSCLPIEILHHIGEYIQDTPSIVSAACVNKTWNSVFTQIPITYKLHHENAIKAADMYASDVWINGITCQFNLTKQNYMPTRLLSDIWITPDKKIKHYGKIQSKLLEVVNVRYLEISESLIINVPININMLVIVESYIPNISNTQIQSLHIHRCIYNTKLDNYLPDIIIADKLTNLVLNDSIPYNLIKKFRKCPINNLTIYFTVDSKIFSNLMRLCIIYSSIDIQDFSRMHTLLIENSTTQQINIMNCPNLRELFIKDCSCNIICNTGSDINCSVISCKNNITSNTITSFDINKSNVIIASLSAKKIVVVESYVDINCPNLIELDLVVSIKTKVTVRESKIKKIHIRGIDILLDNDILDEIKSEFPYIETIVIDSYYYASYMYDNIRIIHNETNIPLVCGSWPIISIS